MLDEQAKENIRKHIKAILKTALAAQNALGEYGEDLAERLEQSAEAIRKSFEMEESIMTDFRDKMKMAKELNIGLPAEISYKEIEQAREMIYAMCDRLDDPKEIMCHVRTAQEMQEVWPK